MVDLGAYRRVHFVGIGGIGMSALARHLLATGHQVTGSDRAPGEQGQALATLGAAVRSGHDRANVDDAELLVVSSAIAADNPEIAAAVEKGIPVIKRAELLGAILNPAYGVAVGGTHGKTTTSALISHMLVEAGMDPTVLIGGISKNLGSNARVGESEIVVAEADEYDGSFLRLRPRIAVITNVEPDHLDFYGDPERVHQAFREFAAGVTETIIASADDPSAVRAGSGHTARLLTYGIGSGAWQADGIHEEGGRTRFTVRHGGARRQYSMQPAGRHNVSNALAAIAAGHVLGVADETVASALATFQGVGRRLEVIGERAGVLIMDSYGHHPTEIRSDLAAIRQRYRRPIRLAFQPHTYSRTSAFLTEFARSFQDADAVYLLDIYAARETNTLGVSGQDLAAATTQYHDHVAYCGTIDGALGRILTDARPGDVVITMGAGDVNRLASRLLAALET